MPVINVRRDNLDEANSNFAQMPLRTPVFLNSVPKGGSHLLRNILRMFVPLDQHHTPDFIQWGNLKTNLTAFDPKCPKLSWGHLFFADTSVMETAAARRILLYRDPYDWVIARARFILSAQFDGNVGHLQCGSVTPDELLTMMIFGLPTKLPSLNDIYELNVAAWLGANCYSIKFEDLVRHCTDLHADDSFAFFGQLLEHCGIAVPPDWRERVRTGADRRQSATARENLHGSGVKLPTSLGERHRALIDYHAPGLRGLLGYV